MMAETKEALKQKVAKVSQWKRTGVGEDWWDVDSLFNMCLARKRHSFDLCRSRKKERPCLTATVITCNERHLSLD
jgi:hypothetical protein